jgi:hypothetical protein
VILTRVLVLGAVLATMADAMAFTALVWPGVVHEANPLVAALPAEAALTLKSILALYLVGIGVFAPKSRFVRAALCLAIVAGTVGRSTTGCTPAVPSVASRWTASAALGSSGFGRSRPVSCRGWSTPTRPTPRTGRRPSRNSRPDRA